MQILRRRSQGDAVRLLQERLTAKGFEPGIVDGDFSPRTERAVRQFQAAHNLKVDGIVGDKTWQLLLQETVVSVPTSLIEEQKRWLRDQARVSPESGGYRTPFTGPHRHRPAARGSRTRRHHTQGSGSRLADTAFR